MKAQLIGESSAGMTGVEIWDGVDLVWSHSYFANGSSTQGYIDGLCQAWDDMRGCADVSGYEGGEVGDDGEPVLLDSDRTTGVLLEFDSETNTWTLGDDAGRLGQSREIVDACILAGLIDGADETDDAGDKDVLAVVEHIQKSIVAA